MEHKGAARRSSGVRHLFCILTESYEAATLTHLGRNGSPEDIAKVVAFLLSSDAAFITGASIVADGGYTGVDYYVKKENEPLG
ncbi:hypothetical protein AU252_20350 [Pseudarthrobacter sulfonivorans]|uniref:Short-chain dehydrogenase n=1 Tax=Pseudarthrobacter sulfonivorans TaxID=121292 RepID=A0A0U3QS19_9MICC|nr:SDR family oxidoreductase [Pseudarthrobacter sulfonivorans]ALV43220.1 hypothetical protein AU252_20350 [Pseudarthrobacter sulfonivorans]